MLIRIIINNWGQYPVFIKLQLSIRYLRSTVSVRTIILGRSKRSSHVVTHKESMQKKKYSESCYLRVIYDHDFCRNISFKITN
jgi:hypothetical protein